MKKNLIDREHLRGQVMKVLKENPDMFPTSNKIERKLRMRGMAASGSIVIEAMGGSTKLDELKINWIEKCTDEIFIDTLKNQAFTTAKGKVKEAVKKRLHTFLHANVHRLPELFGPEAVKKHLKTVPGLRAEYDNKFGVNRREMQKRGRERLARHT